MTDFFKYILVIKVPKKSPLFSGGGGIEGLLGLNLYLYFIHHSNLNVVK